MPSFKVYYRDDCGLSVELIGQPMEAFLKSIIWKVRLPLIRSFEPEVEGQFLKFPPSASLTDSRRIVEAFEVLSSRGYACEKDRSFLTLEGDSDARVSERAQAGLAIKSQDPSVQEQFDEFRAVVDRGMVRPLREKQAWDAFFMTVMRRSANFSVPGSGKTASVLGVFAYLREKGLVKRVVVVSPINAFGSWRDEWAACFGSTLPCRSFSFHDRRFRNLRNDKRKYHLKFNSGGYNLVLMNYESCCGLEPELASLCSEDTLLVFDEVHKVKRVDGARANSALAIAQDAPFLVALTGTPIPNSYCDIYNLLHFLCPDEYDEYFGFDVDHLKDPDPDEVLRINESVQPFFCRTNKQMLGVPNANEDIIIKCSASVEENDILLELRKELRDNPLAMIIRVLQLESDCTMLDRSISGLDMSTFADDVDGLTCFDVEPLRHSCTVTGSFRSNKTDRCLKLVDGLLREGKPVIIWCVFIRSIENLAEELQKMGYKVGVVHGGVDPEARQATLRDFKDGKAQVLITNPHTLAESVSLHGVCHDAVYFEYSYNLIHLLQSKDRIHRLGLPEGQYTQYYFMQTVFDLFGEEWSLDANIHQRLLEKERVMLDAVDRGVLEEGSTDAEDLEAVFAGLF